MAIVRQGVRYVKTDQNGIVAFPCVEVDTASTEALSITLTEWEETIFKSIDERQTSATWISPIAIGDTVPLLASEGIYFVRTADRYVKIAVGSSRIDAAGLRISGGGRFFGSHSFLIKFSDGVVYARDAGGQTSTMGYVGTADVGFSLCTNSSFGYVQAANQSYTITKDAVAPSSAQVAVGTALWNNSTDRIPPDNPYLPDGVDPSGTGGGTGTFSETGDTVGIPGLPALSAVDTGFITLFNPSAAQVKSLAAYMWSSSFDLTTFKNIVANPIDCILGLTIVPVNPPNAGSKVVTVGNIPTDVTLPYLSSQYVEVDCGTLNVQEFWGSYLDYSPYTKMSLYLPYIGIIPLDIDDVMNASIAIKYHVDVLSGACVAYVLCNGTQLYTYVGQCSSNVPITSNDFTNTVNGILGIAGSIGKLAADGGASAPTEAAGIAANAINALKPNIQKSGAMSGTGGLMGVQTPYLICQRPRQSVPASQNTFTGYPANITATLSDLSGYTEVDNIHLDGLSATQEEQQEIMDLLTSGVII